MELITIDSRDGVVSPAGYVGETVSRRRKTPRNLVEFDGVVGQAA
ncbi:MAG: hypothetical protein JWQ42_2395 [Edaphobacter sp.]|nr:hypothetical protein [Edaphobacter sp.]